MTKTIKIILAIAPFFLATAATATTLIVNQDGSTPYQEIRHALADAVPGDIIRVEPGTYQGGILIKKNNISIIGSGAHFVQINAVNDQAIAIENAQGIYLEGLLFSIRSYTGHATIYLEQAGVEIRNCLIRSTGKAYGVYCLENTAVTLAQNTLLYHQKGGAITFDSSCHMVIKNNIFAFNKTALVNSSNKSVLPTIVGNIFWKNNKNYHNCPHGLQDILANPLFKDSSANDFQLQATSPARTNPEELIGATLNLEENTRPEEQKVDPLLDIIIEVINNNEDQNNFYGGDTFALKIIISNSGAGSAHQLNLHVTTDLADTPLFKKQITEIDPESTYATDYQITIPQNIKDSQVEFQIQLVSEQNYPVDPVLLSLDFKSILSQLMIETEPAGVTVFLDGIQQGNSPLTIENILPGEHQVILRKENYDEEQLPILLVRNDEQELQILLQKSKGSLQIASTPPQAGIWVADSYKGETPLTIPLLLVGEYPVLARKFTKTEAFIYRGKVTISKGKNQLTLENFTRYTIPSGMALIPGGSFTRGSNRGDQDEKPTQTIKLDPFYLDIHEVSVQQFTVFLKATGQKLIDYLPDEEFRKPELPMSNISWLDAQAYADWMGKRLPTEAEWERAASGTKAVRWPWGNSFDKQRANTVGKVDGYKKLAPVTAFPQGKSAFGILNMAGNVWEWCSDYYTPSYSPKDEKAMNPTGAKTGSYRVIRGGSWSYGRYDARCSNRFRLPPDTRRNYVGVRLVYAPGK